MSRREAELAADNMQEQRNQSGGEEVVFGLCEEVEEIVEGGTSKKGSSAAQARNLVLVWLDDVWLQATSIDPK